MIATIQSLDRFERLVVIGHLDEAEASTTARFTVDQDVRRGHGAELCEQLLQLHGRDCEPEVPDVKPFRHCNCPFQTHLPRSIAATNRRRHEFQDH